MMQNNVKIAITGGICSGKSTVAKIIKEQGFTVLSCDKIYCELLEDLSFVNKIVKEFGNVINSNGTLNKAKLAQIVFSDKEKLRVLNSITHPQIMNIAMQLMGGSGVYFCEVPLLFESGFEALFDNVIVVLRDKEERIKELMQRSKINRNQALSRIYSQLDYENHNFAKYYVIHNNNEIIKLKTKVFDVLTKIKKDYK